MWITVEDNKPKFIHWDKHWLKYYPDEIVVSGDIVAEDQGVWWALLRKDNRLPILIYDNKENAQKEALSNDLILIPIAPSISLSET